LPSRLEDWGKVSLMSRLTDLGEKLKKLNRRLLVAMICYGVLIAAALYALLPVRSQNETFILTVVLLVLGLLIIKTLVHSNDA
jgi:hypothetical protein